MPTASCCETDDIELDGLVKIRAVVLFGPPNAGKTTLYNLLTRSRHKTVNYPGATVESSCGLLREIQMTHAITGQEPFLHRLAHRFAAEHGEGGGAQSQRQRFVQRSPLKMAH